MSKKAVIFLADGFEEIEALAVVDLCRRAEIEIDMVSIMEEHKVVSSHKIPVIADKMFSEIDFDDVSMLILPGGKAGTERLEAYAPLMEQLDTFYKEGRFISAICAAPSIFAHRGYLKGKKACSYPTFESHLTEGGALVSHDEVTVTDHMIMSRGMGCSIPFGLAIVERLVSKEKAMEIKQTIVYEQRGEAAV